MSPPTIAAVARALGRATVARCPRCGEGRLFESFYELRDACAVCGLDLDLGEGEWTGAMMFGWGFIFLAGLMGYFVIHAFTDAALWVEYAWLAFWAVVFPVVFYRNLKSLWLGVLFTTGRLDTASEPLRV